REGKVHRPAAEWQESASLSSGVPAIALWRSWASVVFHHSSHEAGGEVSRHAVQGRILFFEKALHVGGDFVFVAKHEIIRAIEDFAGLPFFEHDFAFDGNQHGGRTSVVLHV